MIEFWVSIACAVAFVTSWVISIFKTLDRWSGVPGGYKVWGFVGLAFLVVSMTFFCLAFINAGVA